MLLEMDDNFPPNDLEPEQIISILRTCWNDPNAFMPNEYIEVKPLNFSSKYHCKLISIGFARIQCNVFIPDSVAQIALNYFYITMRILPFSTTVVDENYKNYRLQDDNKKVCCVN